MLFLVSERTFLVSEITGLWNSYPGKKYRPIQSSLIVTTLRNYPHYWKGKGPKCVTIPKSLKIETIKNSETKMKISHQQNKTLFLKDNLERFYIRDREKIYAVIKNIN